MHTVPRILAVLLCLGSLSACVQRQDLDILEMRIAEQNRQLQSLTHEVSRTNKDLEASRPEQADMWSEVQAMRPRLASIESSVEELQNETKDTRAQRKEFARQLEELENTTRNLDAGLRIVASQLAIDLPMLSPASRAESNGTATSQQTSAVFGTENATIPDPKNGSVSGTLAAQTPAQGGRTMVADDGTELVINPTATATAEPAPAVTAQKLYDVAFTAFKERRYKDARRLWEQFEKTYPKNALVPNAVFWQGESSYQLQEYGPAVLAYQRVIDKFPKSDKTRSAMLKQGVSFIKLGKAQAGKVRLEELIKKFPKSQEAERAKSTLAELK